MYNHRQIEKKWQNFWKKNKTYQTKENSKAKNFYVLDMFPYPSGEGLHVGHVEGYTASDIFSRFLRMKGFNILHPMGWDAFGLPAENYAIKKKIHPSLVVKKNVANFKKQLDSIGFSYDWSREINTTDPEYYRWTQWIFLKLFENDLAYEAKIPVNWCPSCKTVLANEEAEKGECERCHTKVVRQELKQWMLKITAYADRLLSDLKNLDWPEKVKLMQENWIGKSSGAEVKFEVKNRGLFISVYTTRIDTIFSSTFLILAPEHDLLNELKSDIKNWPEVNRYIKKAKNKPDLERTNLKKEKTGIELKGIKVINPATGAEMPVWISDFVLPNYGTGAVFADAHDERDFIMAKKYKIPLKVSIKPKDEKLWAEVKKLKTCYDGDGILINSGQFDGLTSQEARPKIIFWLKEKKLAKEMTNYKLRDWIFSRQRYWGEPIPIIKCPTCGNQAVPEKDLPIKLPFVKSYEPTGEPESPLAGIKKWVEVKCPKCGGHAKRETNTMPQWAGSCWYYLRFIDPKNKLHLVSEKKEKIWSPVTLYIGGVEHAVLHLLYARFWHKFLFDIKVVSKPEPFTKLKNQGLILGPDGEKMSKSRGNIVNPDNIVKEFSADSLRLYEMFIGPFEDSKPWDEKGVIGIWRFLSRIHNFALAVRSSKSSKSKKQPSEKIEKLLHQTVKKVTEDIENFKFNTAISAMMIFFNEAEKEGMSKNECQIFIKILAPFAPHLTEEVWKILGGRRSVNLEKWPLFDASKIKENTFSLVVQINGKLRDSIEVKTGIISEEAEKIALQSKKVQTALKNQPVKRTVFIPNRLINLVV